MKRHGRWATVGGDSSPSPCREPGADADGVMDPGQPWGAKAAVCGAGLGVWVGTENLLLSLPQCNNPHVSGGSGGQVRAEPAATAVHPRSGAPSSKQLHSPLS